MSSDRINSYSFRVLVAAGSLVVLGLLFGGELFGSGSGGLVAGATTIPDSLGDAVPDPVDLPKVERESFTPEAGSVPPLPRPTPPTSGIPDDPDASQTAAVTTTTLQAVPITTITVPPTTTTTTAPTTTTQPTTSITFAPTTTTTLPPTTTTTSTTTTTTLPPTTTTTTTTLPPTTTTTTTTVESGPLP